MIYSKRMTWALSIFCQLNEQAYSLFQQHTTLRLKLSSFGPSWSLDGRLDTAGSGVGRPVGGTLSSGLKKISQCPREVIWDIALCSGTSTDWSKLAIYRG